MTNNSFNGEDWPSLQRLGILRAKKRKHFKFSIGHACVDIPNPDKERIWKKEF